MSTRKRTRPPTDPGDEDELSPSKHTLALLASVKKRKLNTYGSPGNTGTNTLNKIAGAFTLRRGATEKENVRQMEEKDELADDEEQSEGGKEEDIWEVPDDDENSNKKKRRSAPNNQVKRTPHSKKSMVKNSKSLKATKKDIFDVEDSEEDMTVELRGKKKAERIPQTPKYTNQVKTKEAGSATPQKPTGRPPKQTKAIEPSPKTSSGRPRTRDVVNRGLKKARTLSREAIFQQMVEAGRKEAEESEEAQPPLRRRSGRGKNEENMEDDDVQEAPVKNRRGRESKNDDVEAAKEVPKGILTPSKIRTLKSRKSVAFESRDDIDLGFQDLPDYTHEVSESNKARRSSELSMNDIEESTAKSAKGKTPVDSVDKLEEEESRDEDDQPCAICKGLASRKGNYIVFCDSCDFAAHQKCYEVSVIPDGDWFCRDCQPNDDLLTREPDDTVANDEALNDLPAIEGFDDHLNHMQRLLLDRLTGQKRIKLRGHDEEMHKVHQVIEQTVLAGEGNSMLIIGARGCGKTTLVESVISDLSIDQRENFHVVRLNGFFHTDDKLALKEIWRQLGREMDAEDEMTEKANHADTLASLLALLSHPSEISQDRTEETAKSVIFVLDEFDLFTTHSRQTLLYNLFDIAQARKAPIAVLGLTARIDVVETLEKRVKSRFSHRYVHLSLPRSLPAFWEICKEGLIVGNEDLENGGFNLRASGQEEFILFWQSMIEDLYNDPTFKHHLQTHFYRSKSVPEFFTSCILPIANLSARNLPLTGRNFMSSTCLTAPDSKLHVLQGLSELELALLIAAARLDIILDTDTCNFAMAYEEYSSLTSRHKIQTSSTGVTALGAGTKIWARDVALGAWERLAEYTLLAPAGIGGCSARDFGAGGRMWKVDVGLEEIIGSVDSLSGVMAKWCREI